LAGITGGDSGQAKPPGSFRSFQNNMSKTVAEIAEQIGGVVIGDRDVRITGVNGIREAGPGDLTFVRSARYRPFLSTTKAASVLVSPDITEGHRSLIQVPNPDLAFARILQDFAAERTHRPIGIHPTVVIGGNVSLGKNVTLGAYVVLADHCRIGDAAILYPGVYIGYGAQIGPGTVIYPNTVVLEGVTVGARCILHSGVVLGADGFGFAPLKGAWTKIPQVGTVIIGDDVEIGANTAIDRATFGATRIGSGTKIDNLVQIGHNVEIGEHSIVAGTAGIAGSAVIGSHVMIGAGAGVAGHLDIGDNVQVAGFSGVTKSITSGQVVSGFPAIDHNRDKRIQAGQRMLPDALRRLRRIEQRVQELEEQLHGKAADDR